MASPNNEVIRAWIAFKRAYLTFLDDWDKDNPELAKILDAFFFNNAPDEKRPDDPADWWKKSS